MTFASAPPHLLLNVNNFEWEGMDTDKEVELNFLYIDHDYAETFDLEIVQGRDFSEEYPTDASEAYIVNESAVRFMGMTDPIGKRVVLAGREGRIIGVVKDFNHKPLIFDISPMVMGIRPSWYYDLLIKVNPRDIEGSLAYIEKVFKETSPGFPFWYQFLDDWFEMIYLPLKIMNMCSSPVWDYSVWPRSFWNRGEKRSASVRSWEPRYLELCSCCRGSFSKSF